MNATVQPEAPTTPPAINEQSNSAFLHVETMNDLGGGRPTLVTATQSNLGDLRETSPARALGMIAAARAQLDQAERLIKEYEARDTLAAILAEHNLQIEEWDTSTLDPALRDQLMAVHDPTLGNGRTIVVPAGQDPNERLTAVFRVVSRMEQA